ncbi:MAG: carboxypeptidase-like regulatory domain-containing protein [Planctomycetaceae bacterium]|jgi:hypothetical protein|nr:carboxypeptidase-like regulatory domain-containing protein [Planctomycetaceae bacterium]
MNRFILIGMCLFVLTFTACGSGLCSLRGKVTFSDDGTPLPCGTVLFENESTRSKGKVNSDGTYIVGTLSNTDGIPAGTYKVSVTETYKPLKNTGSNDMDVPQSESLIDAKYANASTSGLSITVDPKTKVFDITVDRPKK